MATTITQSPTGQGALSRSPILYKVKETAATPDYRAFIDVYVTEGAGISGTPVRLTADFDAGNEATFDVSDIVRAQLTHRSDLGAVPSASPVSANAGKYVTISAGYIDDNNLAFPDQATSTPTKVYDGYLEYGQSPFAVMGPKATSLVDGQKVRIPRSAVSWYLPIQNSTTTIVQWDGTTISQGAADTSASNDGRYLQLLGNGIDTTNKVGLLINSGGSVINIDIEFVDVCRYDIYELMFLNKQGFFETIFMYGESGEGVKRVTDKVYTATQPASAAPSRRTYNVNSRGMMTLNTSYLHESNNHLIEELITSELITLVRINDTYQGRPLTLDTKSVQFDKAYDSKLINYTISFSEAFDKVRTYWL